MALIARQVRELGYKGNIVLIEGIPSVISDLRTKTAKDVAAKYKGQKDAEAKLVKKVREGGVGAWGQIPMPPNTTVSEKDATTLVKWVLGAK